MPQNTLEQWEQTQAELAIRRWLNSIGQWAPGAEFGRPAEENLPRRLTDEQIDLLLRSEVVGRLGCHADGKTYVVPVAYVYDGGAIYIHSDEGLKLRMLRANPEVCFEVDHVDHLTQWQSVIAWGRFEELRARDAARAERLLFERLAPFFTDPKHQVPAAKAVPESVAQRAVACRIVLAERTGRATSR